MAEQNRFSGLIGGLNQSADNEPAETVKAEKVAKPAVKQQTKANCFSAAFQLSLPIIAALKRNKGYPVLKAVLLR